MRASRRGGFALVEGVAGLAILFVITALQIPAIGQARERARRAQCVNNLKQMGLALHNYEAANGTLPMSSVQGAGHGTGHSAFMAMIPYMEQTPLYNAYNFSLENWDASNATAVRTQVLTFLCPSMPDPAKRTPAIEVTNHRGQPYPGKSTFAGGHYGVNWGGVREASGAKAFAAYKTPYSGMMVTVVDPDAPKGTVLKTFKFAEITDGLSFTIMAAERRDGFGWAVGGWGGSEFDVNLVPNATVDDPAARRAFTGSMHPGGINTLLGDGSVKFLKDDVIQPVWYALTTRAGGEVFKGADF